MTTTEQIFLLPLASRVEYVAQILESVPDDWSDMSGLLEASAYAEPVPNTGYALHRFDSGARVVAGARSGGGEIIRPDLVALLVEGRPPAFVSFLDTGYGARWQFLAARALAAGFIRRWYLGWLTLNNGRDRDGAHDKPAEVEIHLSPWQRQVRLFEPPRLTLPAVVLRWDERYGGDPAQLAPIRAVCQIACEELRDPDEPTAGAGDP